MTSSDSNIPSVQQCDGFEVSPEEIRLMIHDFPVLDWLVIQLQRKSIATTSIAPQYKTTNRPRLLLNNTKSISNYHQPKLQGGLEFQGQV